MAGAQHGARVAHRSRADRDRPHGERLALPSRRAAALPLASRGDAEPAADAATDGDLYRRRAVGHLPPFRPHLTPVRALFNPRNRPPERHGGRRARQPSTAGQRTITHFRDVVLRRFPETASNFGLMPVTPKRPGRTRSQRRPTPRVIEPPEPKLFQLMASRVQDYAIFLLDPRGQVISWNAGAQRIKQYTEGEILNRHFSVFYTAEDRARKWPDKELERATTEGRFEDEGWRVRKDGSRFWANVVITALRDDRGRLLAFSKITRDLTERRKHEEEMRQSEERFRLLVEGVQDYAIYMLNPEGLVTSWNLGAHRIKGYDGSEIIGQHFSRFFSNEDIESGKPWSELAIARETGRVEDEGWRVRKEI